MTEPCPDCTEAEMCPRCRTLRQMTAVMLLGRLRRTYLLGEDIDTQAYEGEGHR